MSAVRESAPPVAGAAPLTAAATSTGYSYYVLFILTAVYTFNFVDRSIIAIVSPAVKEELHLSDSMLGLLKGLAFAVLYTTLGIPIAWLADRWNRVSIVSISLAVWSAFTALSGFAQSATQLALARVGVGVGEAGGSPPSHAIIADYFPKEKRASALAIYSLGIPIGQAFAFLAGGWVLQEFGWRNAFFVVGAPGVILAILLKLTVKEPVRGGQDNAAAAPPVKFSDGVTRLLAIPSFWGLLAAATFASFTGYGTGMWAVDFYRRVFALAYYPDIALPLGLLNGIAYLLGTWLGGFLTDRFGKKDKGAYAFIPALGLLLTIPCGLAQTWAPTPFWSFFWTAPFLIGLGMYLGPTWALVQTLAPVNLRAFAIAFMFFILNIVALGGAPLWVGMLSDLLTPTYGEATALRLALTSLGITSGLAALAYFWTARKLPGDWAKATA